MNLSISDVKPFIGSKNFEESRDFYLAMGWTQTFESADLVELQLGNHRFYLQRYYHRHWCENSMLHITVEDAQSWYDKTKHLLEIRAYGKAKVQKPELQGYGALVTFVWDPAGVLLHFAQPTGHM